MSLTKRIGLGVLLLALLGSAIAGASLYQQGYRAFVVRTGSMAPAIPAGDLVIDRPLSGNLRAGDVITFQVSPTELVTHRVTSTGPEGIRTKGDANTDPDVWTVPKRRIVGVVDAHVPNAGYLVVFMQQPTGAAALMTLGVAFLLLWGLFFPPAPAANAAATRSRVQSPRIWRLYRSQPKEA